MLVVMWTGGESCTRDTALSFLLNSITYIIVSRELSMNHWTEVYRSDSTMNAQLKKRMLELHGLHPFLAGENLASIVGMGGLGLPCRILVKPEEVDRAKKILSRIDGPKLAFSADEPEKCPSCHVDWEPGFRVCWNCETELS